jgi:hypothetical protein
MAAAVVAVSQLVQQNGPDETVSVCNDEKRRKYATHNAEKLTVLPWKEIGVCETAVRRCRCQRAQSREHVIVGWH